MELTAPPRLSRVPLWALVASTIVGLTVWCVSRHDPVETAPLTITLRVGPGETGRCEPLIAMGPVRGGDTLFLRYSDAHAIVFGYDSWEHQVVIGTKSLPVATEQAFTLHIELPSLTHPSGHGGSELGQIRVRTDSEVLLDAPVWYHARIANEPRWFGQNHIGSSWSVAELRGTITQNGTPLRGAVPRVIPFQARAAGWLADCPQQILAVLLVGFGVFWLGRRAAARNVSWPRISRFIGTAGYQHRWFLGSLVVAGVIFTAATTYGTFRLTEPEAYGVFYDFQAGSLLQGRLDVPEEGITGEAFIAHGKFYGYFGPIPAILRLPFAVFDVGFGRLARIYMLGYFVAALAATYLMLREAVRWISGADATPSRWATATIIINAGLGSTLLFLGGRAMMYHEAILCGACLALWSTWCSLRQLKDPARRHWLGAWVCGLAAMQTRPPAGLFSLTLIALVVGYQGLRGQPINGGAPPSRPDRSRTRVHAFIVALGAMISVLSFNAVGYLKFGTFDGAPLRLSQPYTPQRLAAVDGKSFHLVNLPFVFYTYFVHESLDVRRNFPYVTMAPTESGFLQPKKMDLPDFTVAIPWAMSGLFTSALLSWYAFARHRSVRWAVALPWLAAVPMTAALCAAIATAHRYTADFCPWLIASATFGIAAIDAVAVGWQRWLRVVLALLAIWSALVNMGLVLDYQGTWAPNLSDTIKERYQHTFRRIDALFGPK
jgi:hypothetical protein